MLGTHSPLAGPQKQQFLFTEVRRFTQVFSSVTFIIDYVLSIREPTPVERHHSDEADLCLLLTLAIAPMVRWHSNSFTVEVQMVDSRRY